MAPLVGQKIDVGSLVKRLPGVKELARIVRDLRKQIAQMDAKLTQTEAKLALVQARTHRFNAETRIFLELTLLEGVTRSREEPTPPFGRQ